jgi:hypothetical protein
MTNWMTDPQVVETSTEFRTVFDDWEAVGGPDELGTCQQSRRFVIRPACWSRALHPQGLKQPMPIPKQ